MDSRLVLKQEDYTRQRIKMRPFWFRRPNNTYNINMSVLNDYHNFLKENPGIINNKLSFDCSPSPTRPAAVEYRLQGRLRSYVPPPLSGGESAPATTSPLSRIDTPNYDMYFLCTPLPQTPFLLQQIQEPSTNLQVYKKLMGNPNRDLIREAEPNSTRSHKHLMQNMTRNNCRSTNYTCFAQPRRHWHDTHHGQRRVSLLTRQNEGPPDHHRPQVTL